MHPADRHPHVANLHALDVFVAALRLYRREPARVAGAALALLLPPVALGIGSGRAVDALRDGPLQGRIVLVLAVGLVAGVLTNLGTIFYAGVLDELVGSVIRDDRRPSIGEAMRALPIWALIGADLAVTALVGLTSALAVVPGFLLMAMLGIVGPLVNIEHIAADRGDPSFAAAHRRAICGWSWWWSRSRSASRSLRTTGCCTCGTRPTCSPRSRCRCRSSLTVGAFVGLAEVELAYALLARDEGSSVARMVAATAPAGSEPREAPPTA